MNGFINMLKPPGMTSAEVVAAVRRLAGGVKVGHAGTLDPEASGVLPVMVGKAARLFDCLVDKEKEYIAEVAFGAATDTQDASGNVTARGENYPNRERVLAALPRLTGEISQRPSAFSAIKREGVPLYARVRRGETVEVPERLVFVREMVLGEKTPGHGFMLRVRCGRGTYIRSICHDLGVLLDCPAHMRFLLRTRTGYFSLESAYTLEEAEEAAQNGCLSHLLLLPDAPLEHIPRAEIPNAWEKAVRSGGKLPLSAAVFSAPVGEREVVRVYCRGSFWGIAERRGQQLAWRALIAPEE